MPSMSAFQPLYGSGQALAAAAASGNTVIDAPRKSNQLRIANTGNNIAFVRTFDSSAGVQSATTADYAVPPASITTISKPDAHNSIAHISAAGTTLQVILGEGI